MMCMQTVSYMLLYKTQLFANNQFNFSVIRKLCFKHFTSQHDSLLLLYARFTVLFTFYEIGLGFTHLQQWTVCSRLAFSQRTSDFQKRITVVKQDLLYSERLGGPRLTVLPRRGVCEGPCLRHCNKHCISHVLRTSYKKCHCHSFDYFSMGEFVKISSS